MGIRDKRVDDYIAKAAPFAQPILRQIREIVHEGCLEVEETIKWGFPHFMQGGIICSMAAFKKHCALAFWKGSLILDRKENKSAEAMGQFGRITSLHDLPSRKVLIGYIKKVRELKHSGVKKVNIPRTREKKELVVPDYFLMAVKKNRKALATFDAFSYSKRKEYVEWVADAKTDDTRSRRMQTAVEWLSEGKARNWKYERC